MVLQDSNGKVGILPLPGPCVEAVLGIYTVDSPDRG